MIIVHAADLHLGSPLGGLDQHADLPAERIRAASMDAFRALARLCEEREADLLLVAGDVFDGDAAHGVIREAAQVLRDITAAGTRVVTIRGNHDALSRMQRNLPTIEGLVELSSRAPETLLLEELGVAVHGRGFDEARVPDNIVSTYPRRVEGMFNIGLLHTSLEGNAAHASYAPCHVDDLVAHGYDYWALGHIHQHGIVRAGSPWVVYAGSPQGRHIGEVGAHGAYVLELKDGKLVGEPQHEELAVLRWHHVIVQADTTVADAEELVARAAEQLAAVAADGDVLHVARLELTGHSDAHVELMREPGRWREALVDAADAARCHLEKVKIRTQPSLPPADVLRAQDDAVGALARHLAADALVWADADASPDAPATIEKLDTKLRVLGSDGDALRNVPITTEELDAASNELIARLQRAVHEQVEVER